MQTKLTFKQSITAGLMAGITAAVINAILFFVLHAAGILTDDVFVQPDTPLTVVPVIIASILPSLVGAMIFFLFERYTQNGFRIFSIVASLFFVVTLSSPFMAIPGITMTYGIGLLFMHAVVFAALLFFIKRARNNNA